MRENAENHLSLETNRGSSSVHISVAAGALSVASVSGKLVCSTDD